MIKFSVLLLVVCACSSVRHFSHADLLCLELRDTTVVSPYVIRFNETVIKGNHHLNLGGRVESLQGTPLCGVPVQIGHWQHDDEGSYFFIRIETATDSAGSFRIVTDIRPEESLIVESPLETRFFQIGEALDGIPCDR